MKRIDLIIDSALVILTVALLATIFRLGGL